MKVVVSGASGLVGSALLPFLREQGHEVLRLTREAADAPDAVAWDPKAWTIDAAKLAGAGAVVHLAGEPIADGRWTAERKEKIRQSRVDGTRFLAQTLAALPEPPEVLVSTSAVGYYGDRGEEELTEESPVGIGFLSEVCRQWEASAEPARAAGIRVVHPRFGMVLAKQGGALEKMLPPFRLGLGARLGSGEQWMSWIHLQDLVRLLHFSIEPKQAIEREALAGAVNAVAPEPVRNRDFTAALAAALGKKARLAAPAFALELLYGEMAEEMLLSSAKVSPRRLQGTDFDFRFSTLAAALRDLLGNS